MGLQPLADRLAALARLQGMLGCAAVDPESGMVLVHAGPDSLIPAMEAACDHWRVQARRSQFSAFGACRALVVIQDAARITLTRLGPRQLLVCFSREPDTVAWDAWKARVGDLVALQRD